LKPQISQIKNYFIFGHVKKNLWSSLQRIIELFTHKNVIKLSKIWGWDPGAEIRDPEKSYSGSRGQKGTGSWIPDPDPQHCTIGDLLETPSNTSTLTI